MPDDPTTGTEQPLPSEQVIPRPVQPQPAPSPSNDDILHAAEDTNKAREEQDRIWQTLRDAKPSFLTDGFGLRGPQTPQVRRTTDFNQGQIVRQQVFPAFPPEETPATVQQITGEAVPKITFICSDASTSAGDPPVVTYKVHVADGEFNGNLPDGMGDGDFEIEIPISESQPDFYVYILVTFDPTTLEPTSVTIGAGTEADIPESRIDEEGGFSVWILCEAFLDDDGNFQVINSRVGNINVAFLYGFENGQPSQFPVDCEPGSLEIPVDDLPGSP